MPVRNKTYESLKAERNQLIEENRALKENLSYHKTEIENLNKKFVINENDENDKVIFEINLEKDEILPTVSMKQSSIDWLAENEYISFDQIEDQTAQTLAMLLIVYNGLSNMIEDLQIES